MQSDSKRNSPRRAGRIGAALVLVMIPAAMARADTTPRENMPYGLAFDPENIAPTPATVRDDKVEVFGTPRTVTAHPCTLWDQQDIAELKEQIGKNPQARDAMKQLQTVADRLIARPPVVPPVTDHAADSNTFHAHAANAGAMSDLATAYALTGNAAYGQACRDLLLAYAQNYPKYKHPDGWTEKRYRSAQDGRITGQFLEDGTWLVHASFAYDLVHDLPGWTDDQRKQVHDDLLAAISAEFYAPVLKDTDYINATHNRSVICTSGVLMAGYACDDPNLVNLALYGQGGTAQSPKGGVLGTHFTTQCILPDGLWVEGAPGYQLGIASCGLANDAETLWHHGIDIYRFDGGALKHLLDSAIVLAYPDPKLTMPCLHDSGRQALLDNRGWLNNEIGVPYECGYRRYHDSRYLPIIANATKNLSMTVHAGPPSLFTDLPEQAAAPTPELASANFYSVGYGVLRVPTANSANQLILEYGPSGSHGHPSKLAIDLFALGDTQCPFPGVIFPYNDLLDVKWYWTTLGNSTVTVDQKPQIYSGNRYKFPRNLPNPEAKQLIFAPAQTMGLQRAWSTSIYPGVTQDRAIFITENYVADLFANTSDSAHTYDQAWHFRGKLQTALKTEPKEFPAPVADGYNGLSEVRHARSSDAWSAEITTAAGKRVALLAGANADVDVIFGRGHFFTDQPKNDEFPPTVIQRLTDRKSALFASAIDISGQPDGYLKNVKTTGGLDVGHAVLEVTTARGTDLCFAAYRPGVHDIANIKTDAEQAFVRTDGSAITAITLAGGTFITLGDVKLTRDKPGLASIEKLPSGGYALTNASPTDATLTVVLPGLAGASIQEKNHNAIQATAAGSVTVALHAGEIVRFSGATKRSPE